VTSPQERPEEPDRPDPQAVRFRRVVWIGGTAVGLWFVADGLRGVWPGAGPLARVLIGVVAVAVVLAVVLGIVSVVRRRRGD
jgi:hypothetical protein